MHYKKTIASAAKGDLTVRLKPDSMDELGELMLDCNTLFEKTGDALLRIKEATVALNSASKNLLTVSDGMAGSSSETN